MLLLRKLIKSKTKHSTQLEKYVKLPIRCHCEEYATKQSHIYKQAIDCFAVLAMTISL